MNQETDESADHPGRASSPVWRMMAILSKFSERQSWGVRELAAELSFPRSSVHRILQELSEAGFLATEDSGTYRVTPALLRFALDLAESFRVPRAAQPYLEAARDETDSTCVLVVYDRGRRQVAGVAAAESNQPVRFSADATREFTDVIRGASGRGVLAFLNPAERQRVLDAMPKKPQAGGPGRAELEAELKTIRRRGWAASQGENRHFANGVCAPVFGSSGEVIGGLLIAWPQGSRDPKAQGTFGGAAVRYANAISLELGCPPEVINQL